MKERLKSDNFIFLSKQTQVSEENTSWASWITEWEGFLKGEQCLETEALIVLVMSGLCKSSAGALINDLGSNQLQRAEILISLFSCGQCRDPAVSSMGSKLSMFREGL